VAPFSLVSLVRGVEDLFTARSAARGVPLVIELSDDMPASVVGDEGKLRQILFNLVGNAVKFTTTGAITLRVAWREGRAFVEVADTGPGIAREELDRLFEPFAQTESGRRSAEGTGLGLTITRRFVELMGGDVHVESEVGRGSTFRFDVALPRANTADSVDARRATRLAPGESAHTVLVVDDKQENRRLLTALLEPMGFVVREAVDGAAAAAVFEEWRPEIVLMDVRMPVMDGDDATRRIRALEGEARQATIVALSASVFAHDRQSILDAGCDEFLPKPVDADALLETLARLAGVRFEYADLTEPLPSPLDETHALDLAEIPEDVLVRLRSAIETGALDEAEAALSGVRALDAPLAERLAAMLRAYRLDEIAAAIDVTDGTR